MHRRLRASIVAGELAPGERLVESEIARRLGVSQAPVREADLAFHRSVVEIGGNPFLLRAWSQLESSLYVLQVLGDPFSVGRLTQAVGWHEDLVAALAAGDADAAAAAFARHAEGRVGPPEG